MQIFCKVSLLNMFNGFAVPEVITYNFGHWTSMFLEFLKEKNFNYIYIILYIIYI